MHFQAQYATLWILLALVLAAAASWFLYRNNPLNLNIRWLRYAVASLRFIVLFTLCLFLLEPGIRWVSTKKEKPILVLAIDNSESMLLHPDSIQFKNTINSIREALSNQLSGTFEIETYAIGETGRQTNSLHFKESVTNLASGLQQITEDHINLNHAATILISDGIYNRGENPGISGGPKPTPVFCLGTGDTIQHKDLAISKVFYNNHVSVGNDFEVRADLKAFSSKGQNLQLTVYEGDKFISSFTLPIQSDRFFTSHRIPFTKVTEGIHTYTLRVASLPGEQNRLNNQVKIQVRVMKEKNKAVLIYQSPHPDVAAINRCLQNHPNLDLLTYSLSNYHEENLKDANLFILHQIPGQRGEGQALLQKLKNLHIPVFHILGQQTGLPFLAGSGSLRINGPAGNFNEAQGWYNTDFSLFTIGEDLQKSLSRFSPLSTPYGTYQIQADAQVFLYQQIGFVKTKTPLIYFTESGGMRQAFLCGEGFWKWNLQDKLLHQNQDGTRTLISQLVRWVGSKNDRSKFRVFPQKTFFDENEEVSFDAELYDDLYERIGGKEITLSLKNPKGKAFDYVFRNQENNYRLNTGILPPGDYQYEARVSGTRNYPAKTGSIQVSELQTEALQTRADHELLRSVSQNTGGEFFTIQNYQKAAEALLKDQRMRTVVYEKEENRILLDLKFLFFLLILFLTLEWVIRKWQGHI